MSPELTLKRLRLETDRTLRTRSFIARALRDDLPDAAYAELLAQLNGLLEVLGDRELEPIAWHDIEAIGRGQDGSQPGRTPCASVRLFGAAESQYRRLICSADALDVGLTVLGTSWTREAQRVLERRFDDLSFLGQLGERGQRSMARLTQRLEDSGSDRGLLNAFAELTRGALLGLTEDLDSQWPAFVAMSPILKG